MNGALDIDALRARKARFGRKIGKGGYAALIIITIFFLVAGIGLAIYKFRGYDLFLFSIAILCYMPAIWWKRELNVLPPHGEELVDQLSVDVLSRLNPAEKLTPKTVWAAISNHWQAFFFMNHLLLPSGLIVDNLSDSEGDLLAAMATARRLSQANNSDTIELGFVVAGILLGSPGIGNMLTHMKLQSADIEELAGWLGRGLRSMKRSKQNFGGIGRDWSFGFTPLLDRFGQNISLAIAHHGAHFGWLTTSPGVHAIESAFDRHATAIAVVGPPGIGKTSHVYALAQLLIEGKTTQRLAYHQIIGLDAAFIISNARGPGSLEYIMNSLANEAAHAGHIILFFDNAELFFGQGPGSFDAANILLPIIQSQRLSMIMDFTPADFQRLKARVPSLANLLTPVVLSEPAEVDVMHVLEDTAINFEGQHNLLITYEALRSAYRLSGRYNQDEAYPGRAIKLLEAALSHSEQDIVTAKSVEQAVEQTSGVKVGAAAPVEADTLLHLENKIHERMINQTRAVSVVANALRRARAGVANPRRPIGSFLFLGPTGVGKTELAKSLAAEYFGSESNMIRLDMSEYQQPDDVQRLIASGERGTGSLLLSVRQQPFSVVLLDEVEKSHPNVLNLMLQMLDEGQLTDELGRSASFKDCIIIATSNAGAQEIRERVDRGEDLESFEEAFTNQLINSGQFKPELLNRFDEIVLFRPLKPQELAQVVQLMLQEVNQTLKQQNISVELTPPAIGKIVENGYDPRLGARPMRRTLQRAVEDTIAQKILAGEITPGSHVVLDVQDLHLS